MLFRILRYLFSLEKNRGIFKAIFPPGLLGPFIDIGNFVKSMSKYKTVAAAYDSLDGDTVVAILDEFEKIEKMESGKR